jgi:addiction module HigA family antidote
MNKRLGIKKGQEKKPGNKLLPPIHPGEILKEEFMVPLQLSANKLSKLLSVPANRITQIINGKRAISADTAYRLAKCFGTSVDLWMGLQSDYEIEVARYQRVPERIAREVRSVAS